MANEEPEHEGPSLELPSLGFGRMRRKKAPTDQREQVTEPAPTPDTDTEPVPADRSPSGAVVPEADPPPPLFVDEVVSPVPVPAASTTAPVGKPPDGSSRARRPRRELPTIGGFAAAVATGLLVGIVTVGLTWASLRLCESARGTSSCGTPGFLLLVAIMVAIVLLGSLMLRVCGVPDPGSTSFLAVGLLAVLTLLFLVDVLFSWWMIIVIPIFAMLTFALSHWVTTTFVEPAEN